MIGNEQSITRKQHQSLQCPVCGDPLSFQITRSKKSGKPSLMMKCLRDGRHFRSFICDRDYVKRVLEHLEEQQKLVNEDHH